MGVFGMAHLDKFTYRSIMPIMKEAYRELENEDDYKNNVDLTKSKNNYTMEHTEGSYEFRQKIKARINEIMGDRKMQRQTQCMCSWVFTMPEEFLIPPGMESMEFLKKRQREYFEACYEWCKEEYGEKNVIEGIVHYDETTPHITVLFVPQCKSRKSGKDTISTASMISKNYLKNVHPRIDKFLEDKFGTKGLALNGKTKGKFTLEELKARTEYEEAVENLKYMIDDLRTQSKEIKDDIEIKRKKSKKLDEEIKQKRKELDILDKDIVKLESQMLYLPPTVEQWMKSVKDKHGNSLYDKFEDYAEGIKESYDGQKKMAEYLDKLNEKFIEEDYKDESDLTK